MSIQDRAQQHISTIDKELSKYPALNNLEKQSGLPKVYAFLGLIGVYFFFHLLQHRGPVLDKFGRIYHTGILFFGCAFQRQQSRWHSVVDVLGCLRILDCFRERYQCCVLVPVLLYLQVHPNFVAFSPPDWWCSNRLPIFHPASLLPLLLSKWLFCCQPPRQGWFCHLRQDFVKGQIQSSACHSVPSLRASVDKKLRRSVPSYSTGRTMSQQELWDLIGHWWH